MRYRIAPLFCRPWTLNGISARLIESHYEHNYGSALNRLNDVTEELARLDLKTTAPSVISRLKREQTELLNSTLLHELYFASLCGTDARCRRRSKRRSFGISALSIAGAPKRAEQRPEKRRYLHRPINRSALWSW
jgi:hypothetical protein